MGALITRGGILFGVPAKVVKCDTCTTGVTSMENSSLLKEYKTNACTVWLNLVALDAQASTSRLCAGNWCGVCVVPGGFEEDRASSWTRRAAGETDVAGPRDGQFDIRGFEGQGQEECRTWPGNGSLPYTSVSSPSTWNLHLVWRCSTASECISRIVFGCCWAGLDHTFFLLLLSLFVCRHGPTGPLFRRVCFCRDLPFCCCRGCRKMWWSELIFGTHYWPTMLAKGEPRIPKDWI